MPRASRRRQPRWCMLRHARRGVEVVVCLHHHIEQLRYRRTLVAADVADAGLQQCRGHGKNALAVKNVPIALLEQLDFAGERSLHNLLPASCPMARGNRSFCAERDGGSLTQIKWTPKPCRTRQWRCDEPLARRFGSKLGVDADRGSRGVASSLIRINAVRSTMPHSRRNACRLLQDTRHHKLHACRQRLDLCCDPKRPNGERRICSWRAGPRLLPVRRRVSARPSPVRSPTAVPACVWSISISSGRMRLQKHCARAAPRRSALVAMCLAAIKSTRWSPRPTNTSAESTS